MNDEPEFPWPDDPSESPALARSRLIDQSVSNFAYWREFGVDLLSYPQPPEPRSHAWSRIAKRDRACQKKAGCIISPLQPTRLDGEIPLLFQVGCLEDAVLEPTLHQKSLMRAFTTLLLLAVLAVGCVSKDGDGNHAGLSYTFHPADILHASAQALDTHTVRRALDPEYNAELHLKLNDGGVRRFEGFNQAYQGKVFDLLVNGEVLASGVTAHPRGGPIAEMVWYVESMEKATRFADALNAK